jgi:hypothetical protein
VFTRTRILCRTTKIEELRFLSSDTKFMSSDLILLFRHLK